MIFLAAAMKPFQSTKAIGEIGGFPVSVHRFEEKSTLIIHGKAECKANISDNDATAADRHCAGRDDSENRLANRGGEVTRATATAALLSLACLTTPPLLHVW